MKFKKKLYIFDLDKTITNCNTFYYFIIFVFKYDSISFILKFIHLSIYSIIFKLTKKTEYKSKFLHFLIRGINKKQLKKIISNFCDFIIKYKLNKTILKIIKKKKIKNNFIIISASPDIYVKKLSKILHAKKYFATKISLKKNNYGKILGRNCFGYEKKVVLIKEIKNYKKIKTIFYSDSYDDLPLLNFCDETYIISKNKLIKYK